jgi:hypothetical protein
MKDTNPDKITSLLKSEIPNPDVRRGKKLGWIIVRTNLIAIKFVRGLNTIRRKGKENVSILSLVEQDGVEE